MLCSPDTLPFPARVAFLFRLKFFAGLSVQERNQLLENVSRNSDWPDVKNVISLLQRELPAGASNLDVGAFTKELEASLAQSQIGSARDAVDAALSHTAWLFLIRRRSGSCVRYGTISTGRKKSPFQSLSGSCL